MANADKSNGYEEIASTFMAARGAEHPGVGVSIVADWCRTLPKGSRVLDLGCGTGIPVSAVLIGHGMNVYGVDASPSMVAAFHARFPKVSIECAAVEDSDFFGRIFDGVIAWGLMFLLEAEVQRHLIAKIARVLRHDGKLLFTSPQENCSWPDALTGRTSISFGHNGYRNLLEAEGMALIGTNRDEGENYYYLAQKV